MQLLTKAKAYAVVHASCLKQRTKYRK